MKLKKIGTETFRSHNPHTKNPFEYTMIFYRNSEGELFAFTHGERNPRVTLDGERIVERTTHVHEFYPDRNRGFQHISEERYQTLSRNVLTVGRIWDDEIEVVLPVSEVSESRVRQRLV